MFALEGDVLHEALREDETDDRQSDGQRCADADDLPSDSEVAVMSGSREHFSGRDHRLADRAGTIREVAGDEADTPSSLARPFETTRSRTISRKRLSLSPRRLKADQNIADGAIKSIDVDRQAESREGELLERISAVAGPEILPSDDIPGLAPPPAFQERFKFIICSSRLLEDRPNFDARRSIYTDSLRGAKTESLVHPGITLAGLGIQGVSEVADFKGGDTALGTEGLRRRKVPPREVTVDRARQPASFRRASSSCATASAPSDPAHFSPTDNASHSGWDLLAYSPLLGALSPYMEPVILLLSSLIWILDIVGWIWLELLAVSAIAFCGCVNIVATMSKEKRQGRTVMQRRRSHIKRASSRQKSQDIPDKALINHDQRQDSSTDVLLPREAANPSTRPPTRTSQHGSPKSESFHNTKRMADSETSALLPVPPVAADVEEQSFKPISLQGMALETLQAVVQNAEEMDDVVANALSIIEAADVPTSRLEHDVGRPKRLRETLHKLFATFNSRLLETYSSLSPLVSQQELQTLEAMYGVTEEVKTSNFPSPLSPSFSIPLPLRSPVVIDRMTKRVSASEYSTTSTSVEGDSSYERLQNANVYAGIPVKRSRARSLLSNQSTNSDTALRPVLSFSGPQDSASQLDRFSPLPARSPRLARCQTATTLRRASSLKEKSSDGTLRNTGRPSGTDGSVGSDADIGDGRRLRYSWRYPSTLLEESESAQSLATIKDTPSGMNTIIASSTAERLQAGTEQSIPIPRRPAGHLKELRLSQSGFGSRSQGSTPLMSSSLSPHLSLSRTPDDLQGSEGYFQAVGGPSRGSPQRLHRKRSSLQSLRYLNPDGTSVVASSPARHRRNRSSLDVSQRDLDRFIGTLPPALVNGLRSREGGDASNRSSQVSVKTPLPVRPTSLLAYASSPAYPSTHQPRLHRATSYGHLTLPSLKALFLAVHLKRKRVACALLALDFDASVDITGNPNLHQIALARYWAQVHLLLDDLRQSLEAITAEVKTAIVPEKTTPYEPFLPGRPHDSFAPRQSDQFIMLEQIHILSRLLAGAQNELTELRSAVEQGDNDIIIQQWNQLRLDLSAMIRSWERGRTIAAKSGNGSGVDSQAENPDGVPDFVKNWDVEDEPVLDHHDADTSNEASIYSPPQAEPTSAVRVSENDDATNHLLDSTSASFLPPPGIEDVFEALLDFPPKRSPLTGPDGQKLSREERIRLVKLARETASSARTTKGPDGRGNSIEASAPAIINNGQVMAELKNVISEMKKRRITALATNDSSPIEGDRTAP